MMSMYQRSSLGLGALHAKRGTSPLADSGFVVPEAYSILGPPL